MSSIEQQAAEIGALQAQVKRMSMTYQRSTKEIVAQHYGLPFEQVDLPFHEWMALRDRYQRETGLPL